MIAYLRNNIIEVLEVVTLKVYMWREKTEYCMLYNRPGKVTSCSASSVDMQSWYRSMVFITLSGRAALYKWRDDVAISPGLS